MSEALPKTEVKRVASNVLNAVDYLLDLGKLDLQQWAEGIPLFMRINVDQAIFNDGEDTTYLLHRSRTRRNPILARFSPPGQMVSLISYRKTATGEGNHLSLIQAKERLDGSPVSVFVRDDINLPISELFGTESKAFLTGFITEAGTELTDAMDMHIETTSVIRHLTYAVLAHGEN